MKAMRIEKNMKAIKHGSGIKENSHRNKQDLEKAYILHRLEENEQKAKQNEKIQEVC